MTRLDAILAEGDPPARDPAFTLRVLEAAARDAARRSLRRRAVRVLLWSAAAALSVPVLATLAQGSGGSGDGLLIACGALLAALGFARLARRAPGFP